MRSVTLDDRSTVFAFRGVLFLAMLLMLTHSLRQEAAFETAPFALAFFHLFTSFVLWKSPDPRLHSTAAQSAAFLWDIGVVAGLVYFSEGFEDELFLMFFLVLFMSAMLTEPWQGFLVGGVIALVYAALWSRGKVAADLPATNLLLRFAFLFAMSFFSSVMASRVRAKDERWKKLEMRLALEKLANGGWGVKLSEDLDPEVAKSVRAVNAVMDNLARALEKVVAQNEQLRVAAGQALIQLAHEKERLESQGKPDGASAAKDA